MERLRLYMLLFTDASIPRVQKFLDQLLSAGGAVELTYGFTDVGRGRLYDHLGLQFISRAALHCLYAGPDVVDLDVIKTCGIRGPPAEIKSDQMEIKSNQMEILVKVMIQS